MKGRLYTRCGCEREVYVERDQQIVEELLHDLEPDLSRPLDLSEVILMRRFVFHREITVHGETVALYHEITKQPSDLPEKVWVLSIEYENGTNLYVFRTKAEVDAELLKFVDDNWEAELSDRILKSEDADERIRKYFEYCDDDGYAIEEVELAPAL